MPEHPEVSVVVPVLDGAATIGGLLDGLAAQVSAPDHEVVVVDNGSSDATRSIVRRHPVDARLVSEERKGSYAARNRALDVVHGSIVAFTDADCVPDSAWLVEGVEAIRRGADLVAGTIVPVSSDEPTRWERYDRALYLDQLAHVENEGFGATANLFVRRDVFDAVGGFDADLVSGGDLEFGGRARSAGFEVVYASEARVHHRPRTTLRGTWRLHRRLGAGWAQLAQRGERPPARLDPALRISPGWVAAESRRRGAPMRVREVFPVHLVAMSARWWGRLTGRP